MKARNAVIGGVAVLAGVALLLVVSSAKAATPPPNPGKGNGGNVDPEAEACAWVLATMPEAYLGRTPTPGETKVQWLTRVAYWRVRPNAPIVPQSAEDVALFARLAGCVGKKVGDLPIGDPPLSEADACAYAVDTKPTSVNGRTPASIGAKDEIGWLTMVAWWRVYPGRAAPATNAEGLAFARLKDCITAKLKVDEAPQLPKVYPTPTPGGYYQIRQGDVLFGISKLAYNLNAGNGNLKAAQGINNAVQNLRFRHYVESEANKKFWPAGPNGGAAGTRINFYPVFGSFEQQLADAAKGSEGKGKNYAVIYIPEA